MSPSQMTTREKLDMYREAYVYHSTKTAEDLSQQEVEWLKWVKKRIEELERGAA